MSKYKKDEILMDEFIHKLEKTLFRFYKQYPLTDGETARLIESQKRAVVQVRYED